MRCGDAVLQEKHEQNLSWAEQKYAGIQNSIQ